MRKNRKRIPLTILTMIIGLITFAPTPVKAESETADIYRLYNVSSGEHFYTADETEKEGLVKRGWVYEGIGWRAPAAAGTPVYRLYNPNAGDHHYTLSAEEKDALVRKGWKDEGTAFLSDDTKTMPIYRQYNPNQKKAGAHNYTGDAQENSVLIRAGWKEEGICWYASGSGWANPEAEKLIGEALKKIQAQKSAKEAQQAKSAGVSGASIVSAARRWVGKGIYRSGGTNPATGTDCSGFTQYIFRQFGINLSRTSRGQTSNGTRTSNPKPGDLVLWTGHAAIYAGNGMMIDAVNPRQGIRERAFGRSKGAGTFLGYYHISGVNN